MNRYRTLSIILIAVTFFFSHIANRSIKEFNQQDLLLYWRSQNIPVLDVDNRVFINDPLIYDSAGLLYVIGGRITDYNFEHPPLIKYLYGLSIYFFTSAIYVQLSFGLLLLLLTYLLAYFLTSNNHISLASALVLNFDPLFSHLNQNSLLDLGLSVFTLSYVISLIIWPKNYFIHGLLIGLVALSKFYSTAIIIMLAQIVYLLKINPVRIPIYYLIKQWLIAFSTFLLGYIAYFIYQGNFINFVFYQLKIIKYWFNHSISTFPGNSLIMFVSGWYKNWWQPYQWLRIDNYSVLWPFSIFAYIYLFFKSKINRQFFLYPGLLFIVLLFQTSFERYYIVFLPYFYISLAITCFQFGNFIFTKIIK